MGVFYFLLLSCLGLATTAQAQDCGRPTGGPNLVPTTDISSSTFPHGSKATFRCQPGYFTAGGDRSITCTNGIWSPLTLKCERRNCGYGGHVENGDIEYRNGTLFGDKMVVHCNTGYRLVGRNEIYCEAQGWGDVLPRCEEVSCDEPDVPNGEWVEGARPPYGYRASVTYKCRSGYKMEGEASITCEINSRWSPEPPTCIKDDLKAPGPHNRNCGDGGQVENGHVDYPEGTLFGDKMVITCNTGYRLVGRSEILCEVQGWDDVLPRCEEVSCDEPDVPNGEWVEGARPPYGFGASVTYKCRSGYKMEGQASFTCEINSRWSPEPPICKKDDLKAPGPDNNNGNTWKRGLGIACGVSGVALVV